MAHFYQIFTGCLVSFINPCAFKEVYNTGPHLLIALVDFFCGKKMEEGD